MLASRIVSHIVESNFTLQITTHLVVIQEFYYSTICLTCSGSHYMLVFIDLDLMKEVYLINNNTLCLIIYII